MRRAAAVAGLLSLPHLCFAQADAPPVPRPDIRVGDRWTYQRMDYDARKPLNAYELEVVFAERGVIQVVAVNRGQDREVDATFTADWNSVATGRGVFNPHSSLFRFPLSVGATYPAVYELTFPKKALTSRNERQVKVVGWEEVVVPAGKFRALRLVSEGFYSVIGTPASGTARTNVWYVPEVKRWVKSASENRPIGRGGPGEHLGEELIAYKVQ